MAPEIVQKLEYRGEAADIWALGVMMFVMLVGYFPYKGNSDEELYRKINRADYPTQDITLLRKAHHLISKMFALDPSNRITAAEVVFHLSRFSSILGWQTLRWKHLLLFNFKEKVARTQLINSKKCLILKKKAFQRSRKSIH